MDAPPEPTGGAAARSAAALFARIAAGRTDLVRDLVARGTPATSSGADGVTLAGWCAYYGDVSALRYLLEHGEELTRLGPDLGLEAAAFHGHWQLCQFLLERGVHARHKDPGGDAAPSGGGRGHGGLDRPAGGGGGPARRTRCPRRHAPGLASWHRRPAEVLRRLCFGPHRIRPDYRGLRANVVGDPEPPEETDPRR